MEHAKSPPTLKFYSHLKAIEKLYLIMCILSSSNGLGVGIELTPLFASWLFTALQLLRFLPTAMCTCKSRSAIFHS